MELETAVRASCGEDSEGSADDYAVAAEQLGDCEGRVDHPGVSATQSLARKIAQGSREPFRDILSRAVANAPESDDWQALASRAPDKYVRAVRDLAPLAHTAYEARSRVDHSHVTMDANSVALELVRRYGRERASTMLQASGMPAALAQQAEDQIKGEPSADHIDHE